ncbi:zinc finger protein [Acrodontium crateriforme]|uniref:Zinc finger protein n=1 Tax=Acrodontium crateriforme TaxID=150365 RepID=A0AAQ3M0N9_9PEZI|nr:zinc finger protein [Acrodontium crateriforme]
MQDFTAMYASLNPDNPLADTVQAGTWADYDPAFTPDHFDNNAVLDPPFPIDPADQSFDTTIDVAQSSWDHTPSQNIQSSDQYGDNTVFAPSQFHDMPSPGPIHRQLSWAQVAAQKPPNLIQHHLPSVPAISTTTSFQSSTYTPSQPTQLSNDASQHHVHNLPTASNPPSFYDSGYPSSFHSIDSRPSTPSSWWQDQPQPRPMNLTYAQAAATNSKVTESPLRRSVLAYNNNTGRHLHAGATSQPVFLSRPGSPLPGDRAAKRMRQGYNFDVPSSAPLSPDVIDAFLKDNNPLNSSIAADPAQTVGKWNNATILPGDRTQGGLRRGLPRLTTQHLQATHDHSGASPTPSSAVSSFRGRRTREEMITSNAAYRCKQCHAGFESTADLRHHQRNHQTSGQRKHKCDTCGKGFLHPKDVRRHSKSHNTDPNTMFYCQVTGCKANTKGFKRDDHLIRHMKSQHGTTDSVMQAFSPPFSQSCVEDVAEF